MPDQQMQFRPHDGWTLRCILEVIRATSAVTEVLLIVTH